MPAIPPHRTPVIDTPWNGPAAEAKLTTPITASTAKGEYTWYDASAPDPDHDGWPDFKSAYKLPHHEVAADGTPGAANLNGVRAAMARVDQANTQIPDADKPAVRLHLQRHLDAQPDRPGMDSADKGG